MSYSKPDTFVSVEEYLEHKAKAAYKSEYHNGTIIPVHGHKNATGVYW